MSTRITKAKIAAAGYTCALGGVCLFETVYAIDI
jgi:hypothetical protein